MSTTKRTHEGVTYSDRLMYANHHQFTNEVRGGTYVAEHGSSAWHIYPANPTTLKHLKHPGYSIGSAATLADIPAVIYAFEY